MAAPHQPTGRLRWSIPFLAAQLVLTATISDSRAEQRVQLDPGQLKAHFDELAIASPGTEQRFLRWSKDKLRMTFVAPGKSPVARSASTGIGLLSGLLSDAIEIEKTKDLFTDSGHGDDAKKADLLFIVAPSREEIDALMPDIGAPDQGLGGLAWLRDRSAFGPGCGAMIGYVPESMEIKKAILTVEGQALLGDDSETTDIRVINGHTFNCTTRQIVAALGLAKDWGRHVSTPDRSTFVSSREAPFYDWAAALILYLDRFDGPISVAEADKIVTANAECLAVEDRVCPNQ